MSRYRNTARLEQEDKELEELEKKAKEALEPKAQENPESENDPAPANLEEQTFKKRYGDLRRYNQQVMAEKDNRIKELEEQLANSTQVTAMPKTKEELDAWKTKYPDVFGHIQTMIMQNNQELEKKAKEGLEKVREIEDKINRDTAIAELNELHPDFFTKIMPSAEFKEWANMQPKWAIDALNGWDAIAASRVIDLYKADMGISLKKQTPSDTRRNAAESVNTRTNSGPDTSSQKPTFYASQVDKMSQREYEKLEDQIMEAMRDNRFIDDVRAAHG